MTKFTWNILRVPILLSEDLGRTQAVRIIICESNSTGMPWSYFVGTAYWGRVPEPPAYGVHFVWGWFTLTVSGLCMSSEHAVWLLTGTHGNSEAAHGAATALRRLRGVLIRSLDSLIYLIILKTLFPYKDLIQKISWRVNIPKAEGLFFLNYLPLVLVFLHIFPSPDFAVSWSAVTCFSF